MNNYAFVEGEKIKSAKFYWDWRFSLKKGTEPEKIKKTHFFAFDAPTNGRKQENSDTMCNIWAYTRIGKIPTFYVKM